MATTAFCSAKQDGSFEGAPSSRLLAPLVLQMCLLQCGDVCVSVFSKREELLVFVTAPSGVALDRQGASNAEMGEDNQWNGRFGKPTSVCKLFELSGRL